ncbi:MAG TPA: dynamin family protein [Saprospiraceae bacterium]|nr:dynamin family protein [Saprospiraceae bacterium]
MLQENFSTENMQLSPSQMMDEINILKLQKTELEVQFNNIKDLFSAKRIDNDANIQIKEVEKFLFGRNGLISFIDNLRLYQNSNNLLDDDYDPENDQKELRFFANNNTYQFIKESFERWSSLEQKPWLKNKVVIALMGKYSSGKSSLINSILGNSELLSTENEVSTAVPTYISYGEKLRFLYSTDEKSSFEPNPVFFQTLKKSFFEKVPIAYLIKHFVLEYNNPVLYNMTILDTPGYDSSDDKDKERAINIVPECDFVFWAIDKGDGEIKGDSVSFIKNNLKGKILYIVLTKAEKPGSNDSLINQIKHTLSKNNINFEKIILFSKNKQDLVNEFIEELNNLQKPQSFVFFHLIKHIIEDMQQDIGENINEIVDEYVKLGNEIADKEAEIDKELNRLYSKTVLKAPIEKLGVLKDRLAFLQEQRKKYEGKQDEANQLKIAFNNLSK